MSVMKLYAYAASGNCYKVRLLLARLGRDYERVPVDIFAGDTLTDEFGAVNPSRQVPVLEIEPGRRLVESNAILYWLADGTPLLPDDPFERAEVVGWLIYEQTDLIPGIGGLRFRLLTGRLQPDDPDAQARRRHGEQVLDRLEAHLSAREFLVGARDTIADIAVYGYLHRWEDAGFDPQRWPNVQAWLIRVAARPGHMHDLEPYGDNARPGAGRSIYG